MAEQNGGVKRGRGRPIALDEDQVDSICSWIAEGKSLSGWCRQNGREIGVIVRYLYDDFAEEHEIIKIFRERYARARLCGAEARIDQIVDISDNDNQDPQRSRLRVDTRKWLASKIYPKVYGDKITQEVSGPEGKPLHVHGTGFPPVAASYEEWLKSKKSEGGGES